MAPAVRAARTIGALAAALALAVLLTHSASASDQDMENRADVAWALCMSEGGAPAIDYWFNADGSIASISVDCLLPGGGTGGVWTCTITPDGAICHGLF